MDLVENNKINKDNSKETIKIEQEKTLATDTYLQEYKSESKKGIFQSNKKSFKFIRYKPEINKEIFLPINNKYLDEYKLPLKFDELYLKQTFNKIPERHKLIFLKRYGFLDNKLYTLSSLSVNESLTRERIRQIINKTIDKLYSYNYGGIGQIIAITINKVLEDEIISLKSFTKKIYIANENEEMAIKFLTAVMFRTNWIKNFELSGIKFLINSNKEQEILKKIANIKVIIKSIEGSKSDTIEEKWDYVYYNLKNHEYFKNKVHLLDEYFLRACYDNYLFESRSVVYNRENFLKYTFKKEKNKTNGIPDEYKIFFE